MKKLKELLLKLANAIQSIFLRPDLINTHLGEEPTWTKEGSFALVIAADYVRPTYPEITTNRIRELLQDSAATVKFITQNDATSEVFLESLKEGLNYKTFFFYESAHGNNQCIRMIDHNVSAREVWNVLRNAHNRIVGFFDSCHSGSMIVDPENPQSKEGVVSDDAGNESMAEYLVRMFNEQKSSRDSTSSDQPEPQIRLYSACANGVISTYEPTIGTRFADAILMAHKIVSKNEDKEKRTYADFDEVLIQKGSYGGPKVDPKYRVAPQIATYGKDFSGYEMFR